MQERFFALSLGLVVFFTPVCWYNMALFYVPMIAFLWDEARSRRITQFSLATYGILFCLTTPDLMGAARNDFLESMNVPFLGVCAIIACHTLGCYRTLSSTEIIFGKDFPMADRSR